MSCRQGCPKQHDMLSTRKQLTTALWEHLGQSPPASGLSNLQWGLCWHYTLSTTCHGTARPLWCIAYLVDQFFQRLACCNLYCTGPLVQRGRPLLSSKRELVKLFRYDWGKRFDVSYMVVLFWSAGGGGAQFGQSPEEGGNTITQTIRTVH